tara:strand:- start:319 stop:579 length:261 start_codon:yes stop_codon:yes gene_type:complete
MEMQVHQAWHYQFIRAINDSGFSSEVSKSSILGEALYADNLIVPNLNRSRIVERVCIIQSENGGVLYDYSAHFELLKERDRMEFWK